MTGTTSTTGEGLVLVDATNGITVIPRLSELRRLNWFDGKLLRADDLRVEQDHLRGLVRRSNRTGGRGVVEGFTLSLGSDGPLHVGPGMAIDPSGRSLLLPVDVKLDVGELIAATAGSATPASGTAMPATPGFGDCVQPASGGQAQVGGGQWYVVSVGWAEGLCGNEEVFGGLCEAACTTSTDRPWRMDGLVFRARAITPRAALRASLSVMLDGRHERSLVASALFADEDDDAGSLIFGSGLRSGVWCSGAAAAGAAFDEIPLALIGRTGSTTRFLDMWTVRRERIEAPPRGYWAGRMSMRPWNVFLAQVLQFQCQLADLLDDAVAGPSGPDPCAARQKLLESALEELKGRPSNDPAKDAAFVNSIQDQVLVLKATAATSTAARVLLNGGIVELPPAGYLPVDPSVAKPVRDQVGALLGEGVDLTFCTTRHDAVAHLFEEAQHLERISLLTGLDDTKQRQAVEIIVPDAQQVDAAPSSGWAGPAAVFGDDSTQDGKAFALPPGTAILEGAGSLAIEGPFALRWAGGLAAGVAGTGRPADALFMEATIDADPFSLAKGGSVKLVASADCVLHVLDDPVRISIEATFTATSVAPDLKGVINGDATLRTVGGSQETHHLDALKTTLEGGPGKGDAGSTQAVAVIEFEKMRLRLALDIVGDLDRAFFDVMTADPPSSAGAGTLDVKKQLFAWTERGRLLLDRKADAATVGSAPRVAAEAGLATLKPLFDEEDYVEQARERLFPGAGGASQLVATRDWILFRRKAVLSCGGNVVTQPPPPPPPPVQTITVGVVGIAQADREDYFAAVKRLPPENAIATFITRSVVLGIVAFPDGSATPVDVAELAGIKVAFEALEPVTLDEPTISNCDVFTALSDVGTAAKQAGAIAGVMAPSSTLGPPRSFEVTAEALTVAQIPGNPPQPTLVVLVRSFAHQ